MEKKVIARLPDTGGGEGNKQIRVKHAQAWIRWQSRNLNCITFEFKVRLRPSHHKRKLVDNVVLFVVTPYCALPCFWQLRSRQRRPDGRRLFALKLAWRLLSIYFQWVRERASHHIVAGYWVFHKMLWLEFVVWQSTARWWEGNEFLARRRNISSERFMSYVNTFLFSSSIYRLRHICVVS